LISAGSQKEQGEESKRESGKIKAGFSQSRIRGRGSGMNNAKRDGMLSLKPAFGPRINLTKA